MAGLLPLDSALPTAPRLRWPLTEHGRLVVHGADAPVVPALQDLVQHGVTVLGADDLAEGK